MDKVLKDFIFQQLYEELSNVEIIPYNDSIWFIDRKNEYWYFEFEKDGMLWWRYGFFLSFFKVFSLSDSDFETILSAWVEEVLNHKVSTTMHAAWPWHVSVEEVLNHKVSTTSKKEPTEYIQVEEVLNHKVSTTDALRDAMKDEVEEVLNHKVSTTKNSKRLNLIRVENALKYKVSTTEDRISQNPRKVEEVLS